jgi:hypothetical protein
MSGKKERYQGDKCNFMKEYHQTKKKIRNQLNKDLITSDNSIYFTNSLDSPKVIGRREGVDYSIS